MPVVYATLDSNSKHANITLSNGNLTATKSGTSWQTVFFDTVKASGLWAVEVWQSKAGDGANYSLIGLDNDRANSLAAYPGSNNYGVAMSYASQGYDIKEGSATTSYFITTLTALYKELVVFDFDNRRVLAKKSVGTQVLYPGRSAAGSGLLYAGIGIYCNSSMGVTVNTGQTAFTTENEQLIAAYELANDVIINRGLYTESAVVELAGTAVGSAAAAGDIAGETLFSGTVTGNANSELTALSLIIHIALEGVTTASSTADAEVWVGLIAEFIELRKIQFQLPQCRATLLAPIVSIDFKTPHVRMEIKL